MPYLPALSAIRPQQRRSNKGSLEQGGWSTHQPLEDLRNAWFDAPDLAGQQAICRDLQVRAMEVLPSVPVGQFIQPTAYRTNVTGVSKGFPVFWGVRKT